MQVTICNMLETNLPKMLEELMIYRYETHEVLPLSWCSQVKKQVKNKNVGLDAKFAKFTPPKYL
jgi:hypothetical protein